MGGTARVRYRIGPVPAESAACWLESARHNLVLVLDAGASLPFRVPDDVADHFLGLLAEWSELATHVETFVVEAEQDVDVVRRLFTYWLNITSLSRDQRTRLGLVHIPPAAVPFADAVRKAMLDSLASHPELEPLAAAARGMPRTSP
jgi:hypothetical protein